MKKNIFLPAFLFSLLTFGHAHAESIVMKNTVYGLEALSDEDIQTHGQVVSDILLKYCWPMCQNTDLTPEEQHELLSPEGNEERFLEKKLNETIPLSERDFEFVVVFVPTTLYELFCIAETLRFYNKKTDSDFAKLCASDPHEINIENLLQSSSNHQAVKAELRLYDKKFHELQISPTKTNYPIIESHRLFAMQLFKYHPLFQTTQSKDAFLTHAQQQSPHLTGYFVKKIITESKKTLPLRWSYDQHRASFTEWFTSEKQSNIIQSHIRKEFTAHKKNQLLLARGTVPFACKIGKFDGSLVASSVKDAAMTPYSISLGSSLFSGIIGGWETCPYAYLNILNTRFFEHKQSKIIGYTLLVNKLQYYENRSESLLFLLPISTIAGLISKTPYFHPRITAATTEPLDATCKVLGVTNKYRLKDPTESLLIRREPLEHAKLFFKYFINHHEIICSSYLSPQEAKKIQQDILYHQCLAFVETWRLLGIKKTTDIRAENMRSAL